MEIANLGLCKSLQGLSAGKLPKSISKNEAKTEANMNILPQFCSEAKRGKFNVLRPIGLSGVRRKKCNFSPSIGQAYTGGK